MKNYVQCYNLMCLKTLKNNFLSPKDDNIPIRYISCKIEFFMLLLHKWVVETCYFLSTRDLTFKFEIIITLKQTFKLDVEKSVYVICRKVHL